MVSSYNNFIFDYTFEKALFPLIIAKNLDAEDLFVKY